MDPMTAVALAVKAVAELLLEISRDQPPEAKATLWAWFIEDVTEWRKLLPKSN